MNTRKGLSRLGALLITLIAAVLLAPPSTAVPMWTRRYGVACASCHAFPGLQLTGAGLEFFRRGHRMDGDTFDKDFTHLLSAHGEWEYEAKEGESTAFTQPDFHLHAGGAVSTNFAFYVDAGINAEFEAIYLQVTKSWKDDVYFTARGGKVSPTLIRNYGNGLMASASTPLVLTDTTVGGSPFTPARDSFGINVGAQLKWFFLEGGVVNGEDAPGDAAVNNHKDVYATVEFAAPDGLSGVGLYYYRGGYDLGDDLTGFLFDRYDRSGIFANYTRDEFRIAGAYLYGKDRVETLFDRKLHGYFVQADGHPGSRWAPFLRFDDVRTETELGESTVKKGTLGCAAKIYENDYSASRVVLEVSREKEDGVSTNAAALNVIWAF